MRCPTCGHIDGHDRLTHRNQILVEWWPLYRLKTASTHTLLRANRAEDLPKSYLIAAETIVDRTLGPDVGPGIM